MSQHVPAQDMPRQIRSAADFGVIVRARRKARRLTQAELAAAAGVGRRFIVELEQGKPSVELEKALRVARRLGLDLIVDPLSGIIEVLDQQRRMVQDFDQQRRMVQAVSQLTKPLQASMKVPQFRLPSFDLSADAKQPCQASPTSNKKE